MAIDDIKNIVSGSGFDGAFPEEDAIGDSGLAGHKYKPISRWTDIPFQLYREEDTEQTTSTDNLYFGLMAYHAEGIKEVDFVLNGGATVSVTEQELNPYTNLPEYCVRINKADIINPTGSDGSSNNEFMSNMELRAIVRPNSGIPRIHQHDKAAVRGQDMSFLTSHPFGYSGGKGTYFFDKPMVPGTHSQIGTVLKTTSQSVLSTIQVYMHPDGSDADIGTGFGTRESPVRTAGKALEKVRDLAAAEPARHITEDGTGRQYVDVSRCEIVLLAGTYNADHFGDAASQKVGNETSSNRTPMVKHGWFVFRGDPEVADRREIILELTDDQARLQGEEKPRDQLPSDFSLLGNNPTLYCFSLQHLLINRHNTDIDMTTWGIRTKDEASNMIAGHTADSDFVWFHDIEMDCLSFGIHDTGSLVKGQRSLDSGIVLTGTGQKPSLLRGGDAQSTLFYATINADIWKNDGDNLKQFGMALGTNIRYNNGAFGNLRRIWFDPEDPITQPYAHYNGYYTSIRYIGNVILSEDDLDANGSRFYQPGTLREYLRIQNLNSPVGVTLSWPKDFEPEEDGRTGEEQYSRDDNVITRTVTPTGTVWQKLNHTNLLDVNIPVYDNLSGIGPNDFGYGTYRSWGERLGEEEPPPDDPYFGSTFDKQPPVNRSIFFPKFARHHGISPEKASEWWYTDQEEANALTQEEQVDLAVGRVGASVYNPNEGELNEGNKFFETKFCTMVKYQDSNMGITAWGMALFDGKKPLSGNPDVRDWGTTQDFLFRLAGTTFPGCMKIPSARAGSDPFVSGSWPYGKANFCSGQNSRIDRGQFYHAWCPGFTSTPLPELTRGNARLEDILNQHEEEGTVASLSAPIESYCSLGSRDTTHVDVAQIHATDGLDTLHGPENCIMAYCNTFIDGQGGNYTGSSTYMNGYKDFAWINNSWNNYAVPSTSGFNWGPRGQKNILFYHNTFHNLDINYGVGSSADRGPYVYPDGEDYLLSIYGASGFTLSNHHDCIVFRNNFMNKITNADVTGARFGSVELGMGLNGVGITFPYINPTTNPLRIERNFRWDAGVLNSNPSSQLGHMIVLDENNPPRYKVMIEQTGGDPSGKDHIVNPYFGQWNHQPVNDSPLVAGGTLGIVNHVPFDMNRKKRIDHATIGAFEVDSSYLTDNDEFVSQTTKFDDIVTDLIPAINDGSTQMHMNLTSDHFPRFFAKRIKIRATKESSDGSGNIEERFSDNILRLQRDKAGDLGAEAEFNLRSFQRTTDPLSQNTSYPLSEDYLFTSNSSATNPRTIYIAYDERGSTQDLGGTGDDFGDNEYIEGEDSDVYNPTWLGITYGVSAIKIFGSNYQSVAGDKNKIRISFGEDTIGTTLATEFHTAYAAAGGTLAIPFPNGTTYFVDKTAGGMTAHGSSLESYFYTATTGTTVSLTGDLPVGTIKIQKPTGL